MKAKKLFDKLLNKQNVKLAIAQILSQSKADRIDRQVMEGALFKSKTEKRVTAFQTCQYNCAPSKRFQWTALVQMGKRV